MDMSIQKYQAFIKTVECGSFTQAALYLDYSQSGISRMIGDLENDWNVTLLERSRNGVKLTSDGQMLLPYARRLCEEYRSLQEKVDELTGLEAGLIRIGTISSVATHWLPNIIREFQKAYPNMEYELLLGDYTEIERWILEGRVDCGFLTLPAHPDLDTLAIGSDPLRVVLPPNHRLAEMKQFPIAQLCEDPFLLLDKGRHSEVSAFLRTHQLKPKIQFTTWDDYAIMSMVESGLGIAILPQLILTRIPYDICIKELDVPAFREIGLALRDRRIAPLSVRKFMDYLPFREQMNRVTGR